MTTRPEGSVKPNWTVRNTYLYLVCLITLVIVIVGAVGTVRGLVTLICRAGPCGHGLGLEKGRARG